MSIQGTFESTGSVVLITIEGAKRCMDAVWLWHCIQSVHSIGDKISGRENAGHFGENFELVARAYTLVAGGAKPHCEAVESMKLYEAMQGLQTMFEPGLKVS